MDADFADFGDILRAHQDGRSLTQQNASMASKPPSTGLTGIDTTPPSVQITSRSPEPTGLSAPQWPEAAAAQAALRHAEATAGRQPFPSAARNQPEAAATGPAPADAEPGITGRTIEHHREAVPTGYPTEHRRDGTSQPGTAPTGTPGTEPPATNRHSKPAGNDPTAIDVHLIMRLLLVTHELDNLANKAEADQVPVEDLVRAARDTRTAAVDLVSAWYGGADQMRSFAEALLAASDSA